nr:class I SAM-dependent methyltransferase [Cochlodiniinecator piscidefendens]
MVFSCILCGGKESRSKSISDAKTGEALDVAACQSCGLVQLARVPTDEELSAFYSTAYRVEYKNQAQPKPKHIFRAGKSALERLQKMQPFFEAGQRHLDIGAGGGEFTYLASRFGLDAHGIDPNSGYLEFGRTAYEVPLETKEVSELPTEPKFDVITMFHVLEHLAHPLEVIEQIHALLSDDGVFVVEVPNLESKRSSPTNHYFKAHITYFTSLSLEVLLSGRFKIEFLDNSNVLYAVCRKIASSDASAIPEGNQNAVDLANTRLKNKALPEYFLNGGAFSIARKTQQTIEELRGSAGRDPKEILDALVPN